MHGEIEVRVEGTHRATPAVAGVTAGSCEPYVTYVAYTCCDGEGGHPTTNWACETCGDYDVADAIARIPLDPNSAAFEAHMKYPMGT